MASIKFLENISFGDDIEIQFGDSTSPEGVIKANNSGLFLSAPFLFKFQVEKLCSQTKCF